MVQKIKTLKTMEVNRVQKKIRVSSYDVVKYQIITELIFFKKEHLIPSDIELLTLLALWGPIELGKFCNAAAKKLYKNIEMEEFSVRAQNVRNRMAKLEKRSIIEKINNGKRQIQISRSLNIYGKGNVLLDYNILAVESTKA
jgi:hypothetical protein